MISCVTLHAHDIALNITDVNTAVQGHLAMRNVTQLKGNILAPALGTAGIFQLFHLAEKCHNK